MEFEILRKVAEKTLMWNMNPGIKAMTPEEYKKWCETYTYYDKNGEYYMSINPVKYDGMNKIKPNIKI